jgi:hypothetical protein
MHVHTGAPCTLQRSPLCQEILRDAISRNFPKRENSSHHHISRPIGYTQIQRTISTMASNSEFLSYNEAIERRVKARDGEIKELREDLRKAKRQEDEARIKLSTNAFDDKIKVGRLTEDLVIANAKIHILKTGSNSIQARAKEVKVSTEHFENKYLAAGSILTT